MTRRIKHTMVAPEITRQTRLSSILKSCKLSSLILNASPSLTYLTGLHFHVSERPVVAIFMPKRAPVIVLPELEAGKTNNLPYEIEVFAYGEDPSTWGDIFRQALESAQLEGKSSGVEARHLRLLEYRLLAAVASPEDLVPADDCVSRLRIRKDESEIAKMQKAARIAESALTATLPYIKIGVSEKELASELTLQLLRAGCDPQMPFSPIVSAGPNSANPHATPTDRRLSPGDFLVIDWGASYDGYCSDITRTFAIGKINPEHINITGVVLEANSAGRAAAKPGVPCEAIDRAARLVIEKAGYAKYFTHRTGHGLGMEGHEEPYIRAGNSMLLEPGMAFTVEPGVYLPGINGVRIEDDVVITENGVECLTNLDREVIKLV